MMTNLKTNMKNMDVNEKLDTVNSVVEEICDFFNNNKPTKQAILQAHENLTVSYESLREHFWEKKGNRKIYRDDLVDEAMDERYPGLAMDYAQLYEYINELKTYLA